MAQIFSRDLVLNPVEADRILDAMGQVLTFDGRGRKPSEYAYALRNLRPENVTLVGLPGSSAYIGGGGYVGETLHSGPRTPTSPPSTTTPWTRSSPPTRAWSTRANPYRPRS